MAGIGKVLEAVIDALERDSEDAGAGDVAG
jgi:hypothetical protein